MQKLRKKTKMGNETSTQDHENVRTALAGLRTFATRKERVGESTAPTLYKWLTTIPENAREDFSPLAVKVTKYYLRAGSMPAEGTMPHAYIDENIAAAQSIGEDAGRKAAAIRKANELVALFKLKITTLEDKAR